MTTTAVREKPILFSGPMVRALLDGRKTQTRRVVKFNHKLWHQPLPHVEYARDGMPIWWASPPSEDIRRSDYYDHGYPCPYGFPGDRLWVRETWGLTAATNVSELNIRRGDPLRGEWDLIKRDIPWKFHYRADEVIDGMMWRPSIHMPRAASRINLELTDVRCERLQDISESDAITEGIVNCGEECLPDGDVCPNCRGRRYPSGVGGGTWVHSPRIDFRELWESINGKTAPWHANPWVWVLELTRL